MTSKIIIKCQEKPIPFLASFFFYHSPIKWMKIVGVCFCEYSYANFFPMVCTTQRYLIQRPVFVQQEEREAKSPELNGGFWECAQISDAKKTFSNCTVFFCTLYGFSLHYSSTFILMWFVDSEGKLWQKIPNTIATLYPNKSSLLGRFAMGISLRGMRMWIYFLVVTSFLVAYFGNDLSHVLSK